MLVNDVLKCSFSFWYPIFRQLTIESDIVKLDSQFKEYLLEDGIVLPKSCFLEMDSNFSEDEVEQELPTFPEIETNIKQSIDKYGDVFPKLNWSAAEDARWIQASGTKCGNLSEVFLLLKSSDKIVHDLTEAFKYCTDYSVESSRPVEYDLILRKWQNINPSMEFRCFVARNEILGICQRDVRSYYEHIRRQKDEIISDILDFFDDKIRDRFVLDSFVMDVYRPTNGQITLIDINPFGDITDSLLFDWEELRSMINAPRPPVFKDFRFIEERFGVQTQRFEMNSLPLDVFNGNGNLDPSLFESNNITNGHSD